MFNNQSAAASPKFGVVQRRTFVFFRQGKAKEKTVRPEIQTGGWISGADKRQYQRAAMQ